MTNYNKGDRVIVIEDLGSGARKGAEGVVTELSFHHGLLTVRFQTGKEISGVKLHQVAPA